MVAAAVIPAYRYRNELLATQLPLWRKLSSTETLIVRDQVHSRITLDATTIFGLWPPELRFVRKQWLYFRWSHRDAGDCASLSRDAALKRFRDSLNAGSLKALRWVDGANARVYLRPDAIPEVLRYMSRLCDRDFYANDKPSGTVTESLMMHEGACEVCLSLFGTLHHGILVPRYKRTDCEIRACGNYIGPAATERHGQLPVVWFSNIRPSQGSHWLFHLLLSMGEFDNEVSLFSCASMRQAFIKARLLHPPNDAECPASARFVATSGS